LTDNDRVQGQGIAVYVGQDGNSLWVLGLGLGHGHYRSKVNVAGCQCMLVNDHSAVPGAR
ncbi:MAG: hypothetical protein PVH18_08695, partial [Chloroflexota bacterium]